MSKNILSLLQKKATEAIPELQKVDTLLTQIGKDNALLTRADLTKIGDDAVDAAARYGKAASDYLESYRAAAKAGYENASAVAGLSLELQTAAGVTAALADQYLNAANHAYLLGGDVEKLREILDGASQIASRNALDMAELTRACTAAGETAASLGVEAGETAAALGAMMAATGQDGDQAARAFQAILSNIRQVKDAENGVDGEGLWQYREACLALNVSLKETRNGVASLRDPMEVLKELAEVYAGLAPGDQRRSALLNSLGEGSSSEALKALLENYGLYEEMLREYADGAGAMQTLAAKTADSWEGSLGRLSNTWTDTMGNLLDSEAVTVALDALNGLLSLVNGLTKALGPLSSLGLGAGLLSGLKNVGRPKMSGLFRCLENADRGKCSLGY